MTMTESTRVAFSMQVRCAVNPDGSRVGTLSKRLSGTTSQTTWLDRDDNSLAMLHSCGELVRKL